MPETKFYHHGRFAFAGGTIPDAVTAYRTYGNPKNPCIAYPTCYGRQLPGQEYMIGQGKALDDTKYFIVSFALFSNGESSSPSNTPAPYNGPCFPTVTYDDNARAEYEVLTKELKVKKVHCAVGFSMGAQQSYHLAAMYPDFVERFVVLCGSARTSEHNKCMLEGPKAALMSSWDYHHGHYKDQAYQAMRAWGRVYSAWPYGQTWFRERRYLENGKYNSLNDWIRDEWEGNYVQNWDANDMIWLANCWQLGDISKTSMVAPGLQGDLQGVLSSMKPKGLIMPCKTDLYFTPEDCELEVKAMPNAKLVVIPSVWGHMASADTNEADKAFIAKEVRKFLEE